LQPIETCTHAWSGRCRWVGSFAAKLLSSRPNLPLATPSPPAPIQSPRCGIDLRVAAADGDDPLRVRALERGRLCEVSREALVGLLAHGACVEDDHVGVLL